MSQSDDDDDDYAFYGTPLEQFEEEEVPRKKPVAVQDQIATDKHGRRRFHGAFTGGFSAGFYNTVGSLEGWTPSSFKSSRDKKADSKFQKPEDFMDDEDLEEFGIAPTVVRAKPEYSGTKAQKRERVQFSEGPIPGEPVLKSILEPVRETIGVLLLMKMGWKPGQGIGPRLSKLQKKKEKLKNKVKIYGCSLPNQTTESDEDEDLLENFDTNQLFAPEEHELLFLHPKTDTLGMDYTGLEKNSLFSKNSSTKSDTFRMFDNNKKLAIKGQAFGVGAFEDDDDDIYAKEDMSQYDFALETSASLKEKRRKEREASKFLAITDSSNVLEGFVPARNVLPPKKLFPPPELPPNYEPVHPKRRTRFDSEPVHLNDEKGFKTKALLTAHDRAAILEDQRPKSKADVEAKEEPDEERKVSPMEGFRPFLADPEKQQRYEKYLHFVKIGAKDAFPSIQPKTMDEWEKERERCEFEQAARLYKPLSGMMAERFAHGELPDNDSPLTAVPRTLVGEDPDMVEAAKSKMFGKLTRKITDWSPCSLLCKRMNIAEPSNGGGATLNQVANTKKGNKSKFSVFSFLDVINENNFKQKTDAEISNVEKKSDIDEQIPLEETAVVTERRSSLTLPKPVIDFEEPLEKKDLFKAIFCSDDEDEEKENEEEIEKNKEKNNDSKIENSQNIITNSSLPKTITVANALRNTSPPRGIFANLDLDALNRRKRPSSPIPNTSSLTVSQPTTSGSQTNVKEDSKDNIEKIEEENLYGPSLPSKPLFISKQKTIIKIKSSSESSSEDEWVEKDNVKEDKKKHKKHKKSKKKHKSKSKKKETKSKCK
ncbi:hypothetical protein O3M35_011417 [Rhynocoris fuscipes]|uniref:G-patch domain-containing protein n=1 Tax=Rhynocoris fuscipes TaxID=488301 RepID=A0AAW1CY14_9HEMI